MKTMTASKIRTGRATRCHTCAGKLLRPAKVPERNIWRAMRNRCLNPKAKGYHRYGGRGIAICDRWRDSFEAFMEDMGPRPSLKHSVERKDNGGNYEPGNCVWATQYVQCRNMRTNRMITFEGVTLCAKDWAAKVGMSYKVLSWRLNNGWSPEQALTRRVMQHG
jgi:hypothetical protein